MNDAIVFEVRGYSDAQPDIAALGMTFSIFIHVVLGVYLFAGH